MSFLKKLLNRHKIYIEKSGEKYADIKDQIRDFDIIVFCGADFVSNTIKELSQFEQGRNAGKASHVGVIITTNVVKHPNMEDGVLYIFESTMSGNLTDGVLNIEGKSFLGCQVRKFDDVVKAYDSNPKTQIRWCKLLDNPLDKMDINEIRAKSQKVLDKYNGVLYEVNISNLFYAMFPQLRFLRFADDGFVFCSELAAIIYKELGVIPTESDPRDVVPADFIAQDKDRKVDFHKFKPRLIKWE